MRITKRDLILSMHAAGRTVDEIARALECHPAYVESVVAGLTNPPPPAPLETVTKQRDALLEACKAARAHLAPSWTVAGRRGLPLNDVRQMLRAAIDLCQPNPSPDGGPTDADCERWAAQEEADGRRIQEDIQDAANRRDALAGEFLPPQSDPSVSYETPSEVGK